MKVFTDIYKERRWSGESASGTGSSAEQANVLGKELLKLFTPGRTVLDVGCGALAWQAPVIKESGITYTGMDVVEELIHLHKKNYPEWRFICADVTKDKLPRADFVLCRDCLMHLSNADVLRAIENIKRSGNYLLLTTTFDGVQNRDIVTGDWREINLQAPPYNFSAPWWSVDDWWPNASYKHKRLGLWRLKTERE